MLLSTVRVPDETGAEASRAAWPPAARRGPDADELELAAPPTIAVDTGRWGRPPAAETVSIARPLRRPGNPPRHRRTAGGTSGHLALVPPPPPPPRPLHRRQPTPWPTRLRSSRLARRVGVELAVATALVTVIALIAGAGHGSGPAPIPAASSGGAVSPALTAWEQEGIPAITALVDDLAAASRATANPSAASATSLSSTASRLGADLTGAQQIGPPPASAAAAGLWRRSLSDLSAGLHSLTAASSSLSPAAVSLAHQQFTAAGNELLAVSQDL